MIFRRLIYTSLLALGCLNLKAQELDVPKSYDAGVKAMDSGEFDKGLAVVDDVIAKYGANGKAKYGAVFGHFYYLKGMLHIQKKEYQKAVSSFRTCHKDFSNEGQKLPNCFHAEALAQWGGCLIALKNYPEAVLRYQAALARVEKYEPKLDRLEAQVNLAKAMMLAGNSDKGKDFIAKNLANPAFPDPMKRSLFLILMSDWSPTARTRELTSYTDKYRELMESDSLVNRYTKQNPVYNHLASVAIQDEEPTRALFWYNMMIDPVEVGKAYTGRIKQLKSQVAKAKGKPGSEAFIKKTTENIAKLEAEVKQQAVQLGQILLGKASANYAKDNLQEAKALYAELLTRFPKHSERPVVLHNLAMCSVNLSQFDEATKYGMQFFSEYPRHELRPAVATVLVDVLFVQGKYEQALKIANQLKRTLSAGSEAADVPTFVAGASLYHLARYAEAESALANYFADYPSGTRAEAAKFYLGATKVSLQKWDEAITHLDNFLDRYKQSDIRPSALYFSGLSHMVNEGYAVAGARMIELQARHPRAEQVPNSYNILGDILSARDKPYSEIVGSYKKALDMVEKDKRGDINVAGYALRQLIVEANAQGKWDLAIGYYDQFMSKYSNSTWRSDVLIAAIEPLVQNERKDEAKQLLIDFVNEEAENTDSTDLDEIFGTYADFLTQNYTFEEARQQLLNFPAKTSPTPPALQAWLYMAEIEALTEADSQKHAATIKSTFGKLNHLYQQNGNSLSNYTLVKLARYNSKNDGNEAQARKVYEYILKERPSGEAAGLALIDLAKLEASKPDAQSQAGAKALFQRVLSELDDRTVQEDAVIGIGRIETAGGNYEEAQKWWKQYRSTPDWRKARAEASYQYGVCLRELGDTDEAAATFVNVYSNFPGQLDWSTQSYIEAAKIIKANGQDLDAMKLLREMVQRMGHLDHEGIETGRKLFFKWRDAYMAK